MPVIAMDGGWPSKWPERLGPAALIPPEMRIPPLYDGRQAGTKPPIHKPGAPEAWRTSGVWTFQSGLRIDASGAESGCVGAPEAWRTYCGTRRGDDP